MVKNKSNIKQVKYIKQCQEEEFESETKTKYHFHGTHGQNIIDNCSLEEIWN